MSRTTAAKVGTLRETARRVVRQASENESSDVNGGGAGRETPSQQRSRYFKPASWLFLGIAWILMITAIATDSQSDSSLALIVATLVFAMVHVLFFVFVPQTRGRLQPDVEDERSAQPTQESLASDPRSTSAEVEDVPAQEQEHPGAGLSDQHLERSTTPPDRAS